MFIANEFELVFYDLFRLRGWGFRVLIYVFIEFGVVEFFLYGI